MHFKRKKKINKWGIVALCFNHSLNHNLVLEKIVYPEERELLFWMCLKWFSTTNNLQKIVYAEGKELLFRMCVKWFSARNYLKSYSCIIALLHSDKNDYLISFQKQIFKKTSLKKGKKCKIQNVFFFFLMIWFIKILRKAFSHVIHKRIFFLFSYTSVC